MVSDDPSCLNWRNKVQQIMAKLSARGVPAADSVYEHEIFVSYRRTDTIGRWVKNHLVPRLSERLDEISPQKVRIFCDYKMQSGTKWPDELKRQLRRSGLLLSQGGSCRSAGQEAGCGHGGSPHI
jgi:hypothetical protein